MPRIDASRIAKGGKQAAQTCAYSCSRNTLAAINILFVFLGLVLIGVAAYGKREEYIVSIPALGGVIACGVFLTLIAILGIVGAIRHNQVILFFYMLIMSLLFILQLSFSVAALAVTTEQQKALIAKAWDRNGTNSQQEAVENKLQCCGLDKVDQQVRSVRNGCIKAGLKCTAEACEQSVHSCWDLYGGMLGKALSIAGGVGLFFSFTLLVAVYLTVKYRNQKDPQSNPDAFL